MFQGANTAKHQVDEYIFALSAYSLSVLLHSLNSFLVIAAYSFELAV